MTMIYDLNKINRLTASDMESVRQQGEDARRGLSDAVLALLPVPQNWCICAEYRTEFGGLFPVQCRLSADGSDEYHLCVCSPGDISPYWLLVLLSAGGLVVRTLWQGEQFDPVRIGTLVSQVAGMRRFGCSARTVVSLLNEEVMA
ncbi:conjugation system SOS inhibitor PsiB [Citrobacter freundii]|uniref:conjugation system SOS inhibitor PsiB n=1 Tax=Enterobacteriaceae TaxID=543 RepID=UPI00075A114F|nr:MULTISPECIES: conjugation system SOS inhibitor PsiB [Enterobacteriaceae]ELS5435653.1 conjugation system SOS inhibitor PsiB [Citrobacter freundii]HEM7419225.1 conjugation system SOS inhibitor PsiB [Citrobacter youngae]KVI96782.1 recombinase [Enterobacter hormaechei subsp. hoffmannii]MDM3452179.1 conjugation system SOS inhibitor PsiB [Citrobacter sp. Cb028]PPS48766.1 recombinase [Citrobacter braakii]